MKRLLIVILILAVASLAYAFRPNTEGEYMDYAKYTADQLIYTGSGYLYGVTCLLDGTNSVTFKIYDNTSAAAPQVASDFICTTSAANRMCAFGFDPPLAITTGIYVDITSSDGSPDYTVYYRGQ
jgi:hypothetical protein